MKTEDKLLVGQTYFFLSFFDKELLIPQIETYVFVGKDREEIIFQDVKSFLENGSHLKSTVKFQCEKLNIGGSCLSEVYDLEGLIDVLKDLQDINPHVKVSKKVLTCDAVALKQIDEEKIKKLTKQISKFLDSRFSRTVLLVFTTNNRVSLGLLKMNDKVEISFSILLRKYPEHEQCIKDFFNNQGIGLCSDYLSDSDRVRHLSYELPSDAKFLLQIIATIFKDIYKIKDSEELDFKLIEKN